MTKSTGPKRATHSASFKVTTRNTDGLRAEIKGECGDGMALALYWLPLYDPTKPVPEGPDEPGRRMALAAQEYLNAAAERWREMQAQKGSPAPAPAPAAAP